MTTMSRTATGKGEQTRAAIIDAALALFEDKGYEATTMRAIADSAGVSVGNAYYYFSSKDDLVQAFYGRAADLHRAESARRIADETDFAARAEQHLLAWIDEMAGFHEFASVFFRSAADPDSALSPFSSDSSTARLGAVEGWRTVVDGSTVDLPDAVRAEIPDLLWLFQMGVVLYWVHDRSNGAEATRLLISRLTPIVVRAIEFTALPALEPTVNDLVALVHDLRSMLPGPTAAERRVGETTAGDVGDRHEQPET